MLFSTLTEAQDREYKFSTSIFVDPYAAEKDGFNIGVSADYQMNLMYFKAQLFSFPDLNGISYTEITGTPIGFNYHSPWDEYRIYGGIKLGFIYRQGLHGTVGLEGGLDINVTKTFFIGLMSSYDYRNDGRVWDADAESYMRLSGFLRVGVRF